MKRGDGHEVAPGAREASSSVSPLHQLEGALQKPVVFLIVPIFGFTNVDVSFTGVIAATLMSPDGVAKGSRYAAWCCMKN